MNESLFEMQKGTGTETMAWVVMFLGIADYYTR